MRRLLLILGPPVAVLAAAFAALALTTGGIGIDDFPGPDGEVQEVVVTALADEWADVPIGVIDDAATLEVFRSALTATEFEVDEGELRSFGRVDLADRFLVVDVYETCPEALVIRRLAIADDGSELAWTDVGDCPETHHPSVEFVLVVHAVDREHRPLFDRP